MAFICASQWRLEADGVRDSRLTKSARKVKWIISIPRKNSQLYSIWAQKQCFGATAASFITRSDDDEREEKQRKYMTSNKIQFYVCFHWEGKTQFITLSTLKSEERAREGPKTEAFWVNYTLEMTMLRSFAVMRQKKVVAIVKTIFPWKSEIINEQSGKFSRSRYLWYSNWIITGWRDLESQFWGLLTVDLSWMSCHGWLEINW